MKKVPILFLSLLLILGTGGFARAEGADIVTLMDASGTILPWFDQINSRVLSDIAKKFVRTGDTFHLISFNSRSNLEIVQPVVSEADVSRIVSRFMLLYPIGQNSDFLSGLQYTWQYINSLDHQRQKIVIIISDGIFNPPPSSQFALYTNEQVSSELAGYARKIKAAGWSVYYIKLPFPENSTVTALDGSTVSLPRDRESVSSSPQGTGDALSENSSGADSGKESGGTKGTDENELNPSESPSYTDISGAFSDSIGISPTELPEGDIPLDFVDSVFDLPEIIFPEDLGKTGHSFILPLGIKNPVDSEVNLELSAVMLGNENVLKKHAFIRLSRRGKGTIRAEIELPNSIETGSQSLRFALRFAGNSRVHPQEGTVRLQVTGFSPLLFLRQGSSLAYALFLIVLGIAFVVIIIVLVIRHTGSPAHRALHAAREESEEETARTPPAPPGETSGRISTGPVPVTSNIGAGRSSPFQDQKGAAAAASLSASDRSLDRGREEILSAAAHQGGQKHISADMAASGWAGAEILHAEKADKRIDFTVAKDKSIIYAKEEDTRVFDEVRALKDAQEQQRRERFEVLSHAARREVPPSHIPTGADPDEAIPVLEKGSKMFELEVREQTRMIGKRNIHLMRSGSKLSLGGGRSSFLIFLVKFPARIADIRFDGKNCSLAILKPQFFPYETENVIENCVDREFILVSDRDYEVRVTIREYEDPVVKINRLLTSIRF